MTGRLTPALRRDIERWFVARGVPQLVEGYSSEPQMDARASPLIVAWLVFGTIRDWGTRPDWPVLLNVLGIIATLAWGAVVWTVVRRLRRRGDRQGQPKFDVVDIATMALLPAVPAALIDGAARELITAPLSALTGIGLIYVVIGFGMIEIGVWAIQRLAADAGQIAELVARMLPLLLILVVFLLFTLEMWEIAHALTGAELAAVLVLILVVALLLVILTFRRELRRIESRTDVDGLRADVADSPAAGLIDGDARELLPAPRITWLQRTNLAALVVIPQLVNAFAVALVVTAFLTAFAIVLVPESLQLRWAGAPVDAIVRFGLFEEIRTLSTELLIVSTLLGGVTGLYFVGLALTDPTYRADQFDRAVGEVRRLLAARAVYLDALETERNPVATVPDPTGAPP